MKKLHISDWPVTVFLKEMSDELVVKTKGNHPDVYHTILMGLIYDGGNGLAIVRNQTLRATTFSMNRDYNNKKRFMRRRRRHI